MKQLLVIVFAFLLVGCSIKPEPSKPISKLRIEPNFTLHVNKNPSPKVLKVSTPYGLRSIKSTDILYTKGDGEYSSYRDSKWEDTPSRQITRLLSDTLQSAKIFETVISSSSKIKYDYILEINVKSFEHVLKDEKSYIRLHVNLFLIEALKKNVLGSYEFKQEVDTPSVNAKGVNKAFGLAMTKLNKESIEWLTDLKNAKLF